MYVCIYIYLGKQRPNNGVYKRKTASAHSLSNVNPQQLRSSKIGMHDHSELRINDGEYRLITAITVSMIPYYHRFRIG